MKIPLPNLDDRRWADLVEEGRSLIPLYAPDWTDHNIHDPGITLIELLASIAEMDIYQLNRITDEHKRKFLSLIGITPAPPRASRTVVSFTLKDGADAVKLPATTQLAGKDVFGTETRFRTLHSLRVAPGRLQAIQIKDAKDFRNCTDHIEREIPFGLFGDVPEVGAEFYLGFSEPLGRKKPLSLYFKFAGSLSGDLERSRIIEETLEQRQTCHPPSSEIGCGHKDELTSTIVEEREPVVSFDRVRLIWEFLAEDGANKKWVALDSKRRQVIDDTRAFTLDGAVKVKLPARSAKQAIGKVETPLFYIRCRFAAGAYDAPPVVQTIVMNGVRAEQSTPVDMNFILNSDVTVEGFEPEPWDTARMILSLDQQNRIAHLTFEESKDVPEFRVLVYDSPPNAVGSLVIEAVLAGRSNGQPFQEFKLSVAPVEQSRFKLFTFESDQWFEWELKADFDAARRDSFYFALDPTEGIVTFGDGNRGRVPPQGSLIFVTYDSTRAQDGNLDSRAINTLADTPHNRALLSDFESIKNNLQKITNPMAATGGREAESINDAEGRAIDLMNSRSRAVTLKDYEELAMKTPGARLARVSALANIHPGFPCLKAPGMILLTILPSMPVARPMPSIGLRRAVTRYLNRRRVIGTHVEVVGPTYLEVAVRARVKSLSGASRAGLRQRIVDALNEFLNPLGGGPEKRGWPFGRDVYRSEIMQVIDEVAGVDHVVSLHLIAEGCDPQCGNVCLGPTWLVTAGRQEIEVI